MNVEQEALLLKLKTASVAPRSGTIVRRYRGWILTWMLGGGALLPPTRGSKRGPAYAEGPVDPLHPVRGQNIGGRVWHWWRLLALAKGGCDLAALLEREQWLRGRGGAGAAQRQVAIRVVRVPRVFRQSCPEDGGETGIYETSVNGHGDKLTALRYVCWMTDRVGLCCSTLNEPDFELEISAPADRFSEVHEALRWWADFDGICSRSRRGLGSVALRCCDDQGCWSWMEPVSSQEALERGMELAVRDDMRSTNPLLAWAQAVALLRDFRSGPPTWRNTSLTWRALQHGQHDAQMTTGPLPQAALGAPVAWTRLAVQGQPKLSGRTTLVGGRRWPSPVIIKARAVPTSDGLMFEPTALRLPVDRDWLYQLGTETHRAAEGASSQVGTGTVWATDQDRSTPWRDRTEPRFAHLPDDPLDAVMQHFANARRRGAP